MAFFCKPAEKPYYATSVKIGTYSNKTRMNNNQSYLRRRLCYVQLKKEMLNCNNLSFVVTILEKLTTLHSNRIVPFDVSKGVEMTSSFIEHSDSKPNIKIGYGTKFNKAIITVLNGGELEIGDLCEITGRIIVGQGCKLTIGNGLVCNDEIFIQLAEGGRITIGDDCLFAKCRIHNSDMHGIFDLNTGERLNKSKDVVINDKVWLARDAMVLKGTKIGKGCVVGAGTIVSGAFGEFSIIAGNPAKVIKKDITWTRNMTDSLSALLPPDFAISKYRSYAMQFKHEDVINLGLTVWNNRTKITETDYYIMYYFCRSVFHSYFKNPEIQSIRIADTIIKIEDVYNTLLDCFEKSGRKNGPCGSYARLAAKYVGDIERAEEIYNIVKPFFPSIDAPQYN